MAGRPPPPQDGGTDGGSGGGLDPSGGCSSTGGGALWWPLTGLLPWVLRGGGGRGQEAESPGADGCLAGETVAGGVRHEVVR